MKSLSKLVCEACRTDALQLTDEQIREFLNQIPQWKVVKIDGINRLEREFKFSNFKNALDFTVQVGLLAEKQDHHPSITTEWGKVKVIWWTHKIKGLHQNDFITAAKTDELLNIVKSTEE